MWLFLEALRRTEMLKGVRMEESLQSIYQIYGLLGFLSCRAFFEEEMVESWESRVFRMPEIARMSYAPGAFYAPCLDFSFNVEVALKDLAAYEFGADTICFSCFFMVQWFTSSISLDVVLLTRCNFMVKLCPFHAFGFHPCPRGNLGWGVEIRRSPAVIWHKKTTSLSTYRLIVTSEWQRCQQECIVWPECC